VAWMFVCCECCVLSVVSVVCCQRSLRRIDHSSRGILPTVARRCVRSRNLENEEAKTRYRAVENTTTMGSNARKTNKSEDCHINIDFKLIIVSLLLQCKIESTLGL
jgi:hypothetical protein